MPARPDRRGVPFGRDRRPRACGRALAAPEFCDRFARHKGGRKEDRMPGQHPWPLCVKRGQEPQVWPNNRPSPRGGLRLISRSPWGPGFHAPSSARCEASPPTWHQHRGARTHAFAVRSVSRSSAGNGASTASHAQEAPLVPARARGAPICPTRQRLQRERDVRTAPGCRRPVPTTWSPVRRKLVTVRSSSIPFRRSKNVDN
jgi:hypothetical protein